MEIEIRTATKPQVELMVDWAAREGWNPGLEDACAFYNSDPDGFFMAFDGTVPVGCISAVRYGDDFGFIGFFIVEPALRGARIGVELGRFAMDFLGDRNIGIDGVENKVENYKNWGFKLACNNIRYQGKSRSMVPSRWNFAPLGSRDINEISEFEKQLFPAPRERFWKNWLAQEKACALCVENDDGSIGALGVSRPCRTGFKIGPLFARKTEQARALLSEFIRQMPVGSPFFLDVPDFNPEGVLLARDLCMEPVFKTARMYNRRDVCLKTDGIFGVTSFELG